MPRKPLAFTQAAVARAVRAVEATGKKVASVEISPDGKIVVIVAPHSHSHSEEANPWDSVIADLKGGKHG
jgi:hypothetical protein